MPWTGRKRGVVPPLNMKLWIDMRDVLVGDCRFLDTKLSILGVCRRIGGFRG